MRHLLFALALMFVTSPAVAQAPSPAQMGITSTTTPEVLQVLDNTKAWVPVGSFAPGGPFVPATNGAITTNNCIKWGPGLTDAGVVCSGGGGGGGNPFTIYSNHAGLVASITTAPSGPYTLYQQGFYSPGKGGAATYNWDATSFCPGATSLAGWPSGGINDVICILPGGRAAATNSWAASALSIPVSNCTGLTSGTVNDVTFVPTKIIGTAASCIGTTLTLTSAAASASKGLADKLVVGQSAAVAGRYLLQATNPLDVQTIGMAPGGQDNAPFITTLMQSLDIATSLGNDVLFPGVVGAPNTVYYFSAPLANSRIASYHCGQNVVLLFAPGVHGFIEDDASTAVDGGNGGGLVDSCAIDSQGYAVGFGDPRVPNTVTNTVFSTLNPAPPVASPIWRIGDGIVLFSGGTGYYPSSAVMSAPTGTAVTNVVGSVLTLSGTGLVPSMGTSLPTGGSGGPMATATFTQSGTNNFVNGDTIKVGSITYLFATALISTSAPYTIKIGANFAASANNLLAAINTGAGGGQFSLYIPSNSGEDAYSANVEISAAYASGVITFTSDYNGLNTNSFPSVYTPAGTSAGSFGAATFSGASPPSHNNLSMWQLPGPNTPLASGQTYHGQGFKIQTTAGSNSIHVTAGPRLLAGGEMIWSDAFPFGSTVIGVTGTLGNQTATVAWPEMTGNQNATVTHAPGAEGDMWVIPAGLLHRISSTAEHMRVTFFPIGEDLPCSSAVSFICTENHDVDNYLTFAIIGRRVAGNNTSGASSVDELFTSNSLVGIFEGGTLGSTYINPVLENVEYHYAHWDIIKNCVNLNNSIIFAGYTVGSVNGCANQQTIYPPTYGGLTLWGTYVTAPNGANSFSAAGNGLGGTFFGATNFQGGTDQSRAICMLTSPGALYDIAFSYNACSTGTTMGLVWNPTGGYWGVKANTLEAMQFAYNGYTGFMSNLGFAVAFPRGFVVGTASGSPQYQRVWSAGPSVPSTDYANGDYQEFTNSGPGGTGSVYNAAIWTTTLTAPVTAGNPTLSVAACPPVGTTGLQGTGLGVSDQGPSGTGVPYGIANFVSCPAGGTVMNVTGANSGATGDQIKVVGWMQSNPVSNEKFRADYSIQTIRSGSLANTDLTGRVTLVGGTGTFTLAGTYANPPDCITADATTPANASSVSETATVLTFTGTGTDTIKYICAGRN